MSENRAKGWIWIFMLKVTRYGAMNPPIYPDESSIPRQVADTLLGNSYVS